MLKSARPWQPAIRQLTDAGDDPHRRSKAGGPLLDARPVAATSPVVVEQSHWCSLWLIGAARPCTTWRQIGEGKPVRPRRGGRADQAGARAVPRRPLRVRNASVV